MIPITFSLVFKNQISMDIIIDKRQWENTNYNRKRAERAMQNSTDAKIEVTRISYDSDTEMAEIDVNVTPKKIAKFIDVKLSFSK